MKLLIASDIHGSFDEAELLMKRYKEEGAQRLLLCGDLQCAGPGRFLAAEMLNTRAAEIWCVLGNCDAPWDQDFYDFPMTQESLLIPFEGRLLFASHGHIWGPDHLPHGCAADLIFCGHTHVPCIEKLSSGAYFCNPGSVSRPRGGSVKSYALLDGDELQLKALISGRAYERVLLPPVE